MKKTTLKTLLTLLALLLTVVLVFTVAACTATEEPEEEPAAETEKEDFTSLVSNGNFSEYSDGTQPYSVSSWTSYTTSETDTSKKVAGIIDTGAAYDTAKSAWDSLANPYGEAKENKLLIIYNKEPNVYGYSNKFTASAGAYYSISVLAKVSNLEDADDNSGATFRVYSDNGHAEMTIPSSQEFVTYTFYVIAPSASSKEISVLLSLGYAGDKMKGYAFFDDVVATKITRAKYEEAQADETLTNAAFISMLQPDGEFDYYAYSSSSTMPVTPTSWTRVTGKDSDEKELTTTYTKRGIISVSDTDWAKLASDNPKYFEENANPGIAAGAQTDDKHVLMLRAAKNTGDVADKYTPTAIGYESSLPVRIEISTLYELTVWVNATVDEDELHAVTDMTKRGAAIILNGSDKYSLTAIKTDGWQKYTFYIFGNEFSAKELKIGLWLGTDDSEDCYTQGTAYFDKLTFTEIATFTAEERQSLIDAKAPLADKIVDLKSVKANLITNYDFSDVENGLPTGYEFAPVDNVVVNDGDVITALLTTENGLAAEDWTEYKDVYGIDENPSYPFSYNRVLLVNNVIPSAYTVKQTQEIEVKQNLYYRLSVWIKTVGIDKDDKVTVDLKDSDGDSKKSYSVNTAEYENERTNDYVECVFYLKGKNASAVSGLTNSEMLHLEFSFGSGTKYDPSSYKKGAYLIASINMEQIEASDYSNATTSGNYESKTDLASDSTTVTNGNFNEYDLSEKKTEIDQDTGRIKILNEDEENGYYTAGIKSWTNNVDDKYDTHEVDGKNVNNLIAGIINVNDAAHTAQFGLGTADAIYSGWAESVLDSLKPTSFGAPNVLILTSRDETPVHLKYSYKEHEDDEEEKTVDKTKTPAIKSPSISLSANSYYVVKCYARAFGDAVAQVYLTSTSTDAEFAVHDVVNEDGWVEYIFLVETGLTSVSANFEIYYGKKGDETTGYTGTVLFDSFTYTSIDQDKFEEYSSEEFQGNAANAKFTTATFDINGTDSETAVKPALFSGSGESSSGYANSDTQVAGVIREGMYKYEKLGIYETKTVEPKEEGGEATTEDVIIEGSALDENTIFSDKELTGKYVLLINNRKASYYSYQASSLTLKENSCYKFTANVRTAWLKDKDTTAKVKVTIGSDTYTLDVNTSTYDDEGNETIGEWTTVNFYIKNGKTSSVSDAKIAFILGENTDDAKVKGYLFIDNVSLSSIEEEGENGFTQSTALFYDYEMEGGEVKVVDGEKVLTEANKAFRLNNSVIELKDDEKKEEEGDDGKDDEDEDDGINTTLLWTYITSIAIAAVLIAVIVAWLVRKYRPKKKGGKGPAASYDRNRKSSDDSKEEENKTGSARDEYKDE